MRKFIAPAILLLILSGALGWMRAGTSAGQRPPETDRWDVMSYERLPEASYKNMTAGLKRSAFLPLSRKEQRELDKNAAQSTTSTSAAATSKSIPPFPKIQGSSIADNKRIIHISGPDGTAAIFRQGDVLESGWEILKISRREVIAVFDGEELKIPIIPYLETAFDEAARDADTTRE